MAKSVMTRVEGTTHLRIDKVVESSQLLVTLSRNGKEWLSPKGWVKQEKGTLLDCHAKKDYSIVEIPAEFAGKIKDGDNICLESRELGLKASLDWGQASSTAMLAKKANGAAAPMDAQSLAETEKRAKEAEKAAAEYRAQMEVASKAREAAQAAALEAARKADEALKAEADRIAEMERAAKAFEDAERKRMEEQRRLERERRLEEERRAEQVRLAEEARLKAEAERLKKERSDARKFFKGHISDTKAEKARLQDVISGFSAKKESAETEISEGDKRLVRLEKSLSQAQKDEAETKAAVKREEGRFSELKTAKARVQTSIQDLEKGNEKLFKSLERAESAHEKALREVEAAKMRAAEALKTLSGVKAEADKIKSQRDTLELERRDADTKLSAHEKQMGELKSAYDKTRQNVEKEQSNLKALKKSKEDLVQKLTGVKTDIARTVQELQSTDETLKRQQSSLKQIEDMENAEDIRKITGQTGIAAPRPRKAEKPKPSPAKVTKQNSEEKGGFLRRFFSRSGQDTVPAGETLAARTQTTVPARPVKAKADRPVKKVEPAASTTPLAASKPPTHRENGSGYRLNSWLLMGIATTGIIALGSAYALNANSPKPGDQNAATNKAIAVTQAVTSDTKPVQVAELSPVSLPNLSKIEPLQSPVAKGETVSEVVKTPVKDEIKPPAAQKAKAAPKKKAEQVKPKPVASKPAPRPVQSRADGTDYVAVTTQVQEQLSYLGFYRGAVDGQQTQQTQQAMREFKTLYGMTADNSLSGEFLNTLKRAYDEQFRLRASSVVEAPIQVAETQANIPNFELQTVPASTSIDSGMPVSLEEEVLARSPVSAAPEFVPPAQEEINTATPQPVQEAALTNTLPTSLTQTPIEDVVVPAKVVRKVRVEYPRRLLQQDKLYDAKVYVTYDVGVDGKIVDPTVKSVEFEGSQSDREQFEKAAIRAVKRQRFSPRTVNGEAVIEQARTTRISFSAE